MFAFFFLEKIGYQLRKRKSYKQKVVILYFSYTNIKDCIMLLSQEYLSLNKEILISQKSLWSSLWIYSSWHDYYRVFDRFIIYYKQNIIFFIYCHFTRGSRDCMVVRVAQCGPLFVFFCCPSIFLSFFHLRLLMTPSVLRYHGNVNLQLPMQSVPIITNVAISNPAQARCTWCNIMW